MQVESVNCEVLCVWNGTDLSDFWFVALVLRVLHRLRSLAEQSPFDVATYSYASPLFSQVLNKGGIGLTEDDDPLEQVTLALQIVKFHCGECKSHFGTNAGFNL